MVVFEPQAAVSVEVGHEILSVTYRRPTQGTLPVLCPEHDTSKHDETRILDQSVLICQPLSPWHAVFLGHYVSWR